MSHVSDDVLAALVLGDPDVDPADLEHVESCPVCSEELAELASVHGLLREEVGMRGAHRVEPGPVVWDRIVAAVDDDVAPTRVPDRSEASGASLTPEASELSNAPEVSGASGASEASGAAAAHGIEPPTELASPTVPVPERRRSRRSPWWVVVAAAACLVIGALIGRAVWAPGEATAPVVASVALTTLDAAKQQEGTAQLLGGQGGQGQELRVDTRPMSPGSGFVEVWLINTDGKRMVSLGVLSGTQATFPVPADAIAQGYTIVDLSHEQFDDKPQHSGDSIMRGTLPV